MITICLITGFHTMEWGVSMNSQITVFIVMYIFIWKYFWFTAILSLYLADALGFAENTAAAFYHAFVLLCYTTPLIGALLADSILGKFKTILYLSIVYAIGQIVLTVGSIGYDSKSLTVYVHYMLMQVIEIVIHIKKL